mgnify:CR=1 FL=1
MSCVLINCVNDTAAQREAPSHIPQYISACLLPFSAGELNTMGYSHSRVNLGGGMGLQEKQGTIVGEYESRRGGLTLESLSLCM